MLSATKKKYMFIIYELGNTGNAVRSIDIAKSLGVKKASISLMLPNLIDEGLIEKKENGFITFTKSGASMASELYLQYLTLHRFFTQTLGSSDTNARADAICCLCAMSDENAAAMTDYILNGSVQ